ncbi:hypothetical protein Bpro_5015 (plasmid) [Polaromonas sp. JS666]|nr:hypothetical protein Bpro_5015 [Polaromonas sp. JS666]
MLESLNKLRDSGNHLNIWATPSGVAFFVACMDLQAKKGDTKPDDHEQSKRFEKSARELEADETGAVFTRALERVAAPGKCTQSTKPARKATE